MESETVAGGDTAAVLDLGRLSGLRRHCEAGARATQEAVVLGIIDFGNEGSKNVVTAPTTVAGSINPATTVRFPAYCR